MAAGDRPEQPGRIHDGIKRVRTTDGGAAGERLTDDLVDLRVRHRGPAGGDERREETSGSERLVAGAERGGDAIVEPQERIARHPRRVGALDRDGTGAVRRRHARPALIRLDRRPLKAAEARRIARQVEAGQDIARRVVVAAPRRQLPRRVHRGDRDRVWLEGRVAVRAAAGPGRHAEDAAAFGEVIERGLIHRRATGTEIRDLDPARDRLLQRPRRVRAEIAAIPTRREDPVDVHLSLWGNAPDAARHLAGDPGAVAITVPVDVAVGRRIPERRDAFATEDVDVGGGREARIENRCHRASTLRTHQRERVLADLQLPVIEETERTAHRRRRGVARDRVIDVGLRIHHRCPRLDGIAVVADWRDGRRSSVG